MKHDTYDMLVGSEPWNYLKKSKTCFNIYLSAWLKWSPDKDEFRSEDPALILERKEREKQLK